MDLVLPSNTLPNHIYATSIPILFYTIVVFRTRPERKTKMSRCVPNWDLDDVVPSRFELSCHNPSTSNSSGPNVPTLGYEMAELTWENGQLSMHGMGLRRVSSKLNLTSSPKHKYVWERPRAATGTLESIVNLATQKAAPGNGGDALVPSTDEKMGACVQVDSCSGAATCEPPRVPAMTDPEEQISVSTSTAGTFGGDSWHVPTVRTRETDLGGFGLTSTSFYSQGNTFSSNSGRPTGTNNTTTVDDPDSGCHSRPQRATGKEEKRKLKVNAKSSSSTRRSRAAAVHNQSERKRRDKINQKMKMLQKLVPNSNKTDKASMLDEVIDYLKQLQAQVSMMSIPSMMMPHQLAMQQQLQMSMMAAVATPMGMGMSMAMPTMNMNNNPAMAVRQNSMSVLNSAAAFMPVASPWDITTPDKLPSQAPTIVVPPDPISTYLACQPQPMAIEAYSRMIALIQQQQQLSSTSKH